MRTEDPGGQFADPVLEEIQLPGALRRVAAQWRALVRALRGAPSHRDEVVESTPAPRVDQSQRLASLAQRDRLVLTVDDDRVRRRGPAALRPNSTAPSTALRSRPGEPDSLREHGLARRDAVKTAAARMSPAIAARVTEPSPPRHRSRAPSSRVLPAPVSPVEHVEAGSELDAGVFDDAEAVGVEFEQL